MSDIIDFSTKAKLHLTPDDIQKDLVSVLQELLTDAQQGRITGIVGGTVLADGRSMAFTGGLARTSQTYALGLFTHAAYVISSIMLRSAK